MSNLFKACFLAFMIRVWSQILLIQVYINSWKKALYSGRAGIRVGLRPRDVRLKNTKSLAGHYMIAFSLQIVGIIEKQGRSKE